MSKRNTSETGIRYEWYALQRFGSNYMEDFSKQKIVWKRVGSILRFCYDETGCMALDSTCFATGKHIKFLVAVLNSKMGHYLLKDSPKTGTGDLLISVQAMEPIKIPLPDEKGNPAFKLLMDSVIKATGDDDVQSLEAEINQLVCKLYGLTEVEANFITTQ